MSPKGTKMVYEIGKYGAARFDEILVHASKTVWVAVLQNRSKVGEQKLFKDLILFRKIVEHYYSSILYFFWKGSIK